MERFGKPAWCSGCASVSTESPVPPAVVPSRPPVGPERRELESPIRGGLYGAEAADVEKANHTHRFAERPSTKPSLLRRDNRRRRLDVDLEPDVR